MMIVEAVRRTLDHIQHNTRLAEACKTRTDAANCITDLSQEVHDALQCDQSHGHVARTEIALLELAATALTVLSVTPPEKQP